VPDPLPLFIELLRALIPGTGLTDRMVLWQEALPKTHYVKQATTNTEYIKLCNKHNETYSETYLYVSSLLLRYLKLLHTAIILGAFSMREFNLLGERRSKGKR
jgi:hypothetical protein